VSDGALCQSFQCVKEELETRLQKFRRFPTWKAEGLSTAIKKPLNLSIQGLFGTSVWLHDLDSNRRISTCITR
jgi:hypothetical protein